jgi:hypothetical protein
MTVFLGTTGNIRLRRGSGVNASILEDVIATYDVSTTLNRLSFDKSLDNILTGDRVEISTTDARGLVCFASSNWNSGVVESTIAAYVNVNAVGGLRFFDSFENAVNNVRSAEYTLTSFAGADIPISVSVRDTAYNVLGNVTSYELNTSREAVDTTTLSDKFRNQYNAGLISGNGRIECLFDVTTTGIKETPLLALQTIQRLEIGSSCDLALYVIDASLTGKTTSVFYELEAVITETGITVDTENAITCTINFVSTGEIRLLVGEPSGYVLKEDDDRIQFEQSLDFLLQETED